MIVRRVTLSAAILMAATVVCSMIMPGGMPVDVSAAPTTSENRNGAPVELARVGHPTFVSPHSRPIAVGEKHVFVANTPADTLDVIDRASKAIVARVNVGIDPVSVAIRPDGKEVWVSNHVSDSVSVIDNNADSPTYLQVVATIQEFDPITKATRFDEPVGIAFAGNDKAYIALSSENQVAVVNVSSRAITRRLTINAQDPRAIAVRGDRLYVIPFESNNKTQLSGGNKDDIDGELVTFDAWEHSIRVNNVLSLGHVVDVVKHPRVPDRDLYVFDTNTDELLKVVDTLGTLLYGLTIDSTGQVFVAQTDARNDANGRAGTKKHGMTEMGNRAFLNRITRVALHDGDDPKTSFIDLEPLPPQQPEAGGALATPFAIQISNDDSTLVATAAGSDTVFTVDAESGEVLGRINVGAVPRGIALENDAAGKPSQAWVFNAVGNSVSLVDLSDPTEPAVTGFVPLDDPTHRQVKLGRQWFNDAKGSTTGTFSCASCHPDGHTDQLLWVLKTPIVSGGDQIMPRSTMPIRGLRDTAPYHWDGVPGDPYGGNNSGNIHGSDEPNSDPDDPASATRHVIDGGLASTMFLEGDKTVNDEGKLGAFSAMERDDMALFLLSVPFPPAQRRAYTNEVSDRAEEGFKLFHIDGDHDEKPRPNVCGNCHRMPFLVSTNTPGTGMDAPTWRGAYDRFLILPQGRLNIIDFGFYARVAEQGIPERNMWQFSWGGRRRFDPVWDMVLEGSTGYSGSFARQVTVNESTANEELTADLLTALEVSASEGAIVLEAEGVLINGANAKPLALQFIDNDGRGGYVTRNDARRAFSREKLIALAATGEFVGTFTGRHGELADVEHPQPAIWTLGPIEQQRGRQEFPILHEQSRSMTISGRHIRDGAHVIVDGRRVSGRVTLGKGETIEVELAELPSVGMHLLQVQNADGMFSNDFIFHVVSDADGVAELKRALDREHVGPRDPLGRAIAAGDLRLTKRLLTDKKRLNAHRADGSTPLSTAALHGQIEIARWLIDSGADVSATNRDGNTPLHVAAFLCQNDVVKLLLEKGASARIDNGRGESPADVVSGEWSRELAGFYLGIAGSVGLEIDLERIQKERPKLAKLIREHGEKERAADDSSNGDKENES